MKKILVLLLVFLALSWCEEVKEEEGVIVGTDANLAQLLKDNEHVLVEFYAPWCGHCKKLTPEYAKAAQELKAAGSNVKLVKVDATEHKEAGQSYQIRGYPTLKWFNNGVESEYKGGRQANEIIAWINKRTGPAIAKITAEKLETMRQSEKLFYVMVGDIKEHVEKVAKDLDDVQIVNVDELTGHSTGDLVAIRQFDENEVKCESCTGSEDTLQFIETTRVPRVMNFDQDAAQFIFGGQKSSLVLFWDEEKHAEQKQMLVDASARIREQGLVVSYSQIQKDIGQRLGEYIGIKAENLPRVMVIDFSSGEDISKFTLKETISVDNMVDFAVQWKNKELKKEFKSADIPAESYDGNVRVLVGKNFNEVVYQDETDVLVEFYAPWCGHCKKLTPIYENIAKRMRGFKNLIIAKVDSTENEIDGVQIQGFPTLKFFKRGNKTPVEYNSGRDEESFEKFLLENVEGLKEFMDANTTEPETKTEEAKEEVKEDL